MNIYREESNICVTRLLSLLDRNPMSPTYGCFHRCFWLHRLSDFPSAIRQQGVLALAQLWRDSSYDVIEKKQLLEIISAALKYTIGLQHGDGSFDEWYPNERGWAGPTGYIIHSLASTYEICGSELEQDLSSSLVSCLKKGANFLVNGWEEHILFNHIAMALLPIYQVHLIRKDQVLMDGFRTLFKRFEGYYCAQEGWGLEYDGADIGYQSATISFLARLHSRLLEQDLKDSVSSICEGSLSFIEYFCFPDGRFSAKVGSRETDVLFCYGIEYWASLGNIQALAIARFSRESLVKGNLLTPKDHEDHYFLYRLPEFLACANIFSEEIQTDYELPFEREFEEKHFVQAKIFCLKKNSLYSVINFARGGGVIRYDCNSCEAINIDRGIMITTVEEKTMTSSQVSDNKITFEDDYCFTIEGSFSKFTPKSFNLLTFFLFRITSTLFAWNKFGAYWLKAFVRFLLLRLGRTSSIRFERRIDLLGNELVRDKFDSSESKGQLRGEFDIRFVPQSRYFHKNDLRFAPKR